MKERSAFVRLNASGFALFACILSLTLFLPACSAPKPETRIGPVFFPAPPNPPRIQFLKSIATSKDVVQQKGEFSLLSLGGEQKEVVREIKKPYGITYAQGKLYVCDLQGPNVVIIDLVNSTFDYLKGNLGYGKLKKPVNLTVDDAGNIYVVDSIRKEVLMYDPAQNFVRSYGKEIAVKPADVAVDKENLYILDLAENDIKVVDRQSGQLIRSIGKTVDKVQGLSIPTNFTLDGNGFLYATNVGTGSVLKIDKDGHFLDHFGQLGDGFGEFVRPKGIATDASGRICVVDAGHQNVQVFGENNRLLMFFGDPPLPAGGLNLPASIAVTGDHLDYFQKFAEPGFKLEEIFFVTNQMGPDKVAIYGLGKMDGVEYPTTEDLQRQISNGQAAGKGKESQ